MLGVYTISLSACMMNEVETYPSYQTSYTYGDRYFYTQGAYRVNSYDYQASPRAEVSVPQSYHVSSTHSPISFKDRDKNWVKNQNPQGYTIEVAEDEKASRVAQKLYKIPKNDRMAQIKYQREGKVYYKGIYGTYNSPEAAQKALNELPQEVKQKAGIKKWGSVQENMDEVE